MSIGTITVGLRDDLRSNLTDPINRGAQWIHRGKIEETSKTPAIYVELAPSPRHDNYTGGGQVHYYNHHVHVVVRDGDRGVSVVGGSGDIITSSDELRDNIVQGIINRFHEAQFSISGASTLTLNNVSGEWNVTQDRIAVTLDYTSEEAL